MMFMGEFGHLATITSAEENDFVASLIAGLPVTEVWLGATQPDPDDPPAEGWEWVTGETWDYTNWDSDEPDDNGGDEHYLGMWGELGDGIFGSWNDQEYIVFGSNIDGYVVEYDILAPAALPLLGAGGLLAGR